MNTGDPVQFFGALVLCQCSLCWQRGSASGVWVSSGRANPGSLMHGVSDGALSSEVAPSSFSWWNAKTCLRQCFVNTGFWAAPVLLSRYPSLCCKRWEDNWLAKTKWIGTAEKNTWLWKLLCMGWWLHLQEALLSSFTCDGSRGILSCPEQLVYHYVLH